MTFTPADATDYASTTATTRLLGRQAPLGLTAADATRTFGVTKPIFTSSLSSAVKGDSLLETFWTFAALASPAGRYPITPSVSGTAAANYAVVAVSGTLTVSQAVTATSFTLSHQNLTLTASVSSPSAGSPGGNVNFYAGQTSLGTASLTNGLAMFTAFALPLGRRGSQR